MAKIRISAEFSAEANMWLNMQQNRRRPIVHHWPTCPDAGCQRWHDLPAYPPPSQVCLPRRMTDVAQSVVIWEKMQETPRMPFAPLLSIGLIYVGRKQQRGKDEIWPTEFAVSLCTTSRPADIVLCRFRFSRNRHSPHWSWQRGWEFLQCIPMTFLLTSGASEWQFFSF